MADTSMNIRTDSIKKQAEMGIPFDLTLKKVPNKDIGDEKMNQRIARLEKIEQAIALSMDEELNYIPRSKAMREPTILSD